MTQSFPCPACGAPNTPAVEAAYMACTYCGTNLTIPELLRTKAIPKVERASPKVKPAINVENEAAKFLRKAEPVAVGAWNLYALWSWVRWILPTCLIFFLVGIVFCAALGTLPVFLRLFR